MTVSNFAFILAGLTAFMIVFPPVALGGICAGFLKSRPVIAVSVGGIAACSVLCALVYTGLFHLEMGRFPSKEGILAYFLAATFAGAFWAFFARKLIDRCANSGEML